MISNLLVVCGMPRSGTTLLGELVGSCPRVDVISEPPPLRRFTAFPVLASQYWAWRTETMRDENQNWKNIDEGTARRRIDEVFLGFCSALNPVPFTGLAADERISRHELRDTETLCLKQPNGEFDIPYHVQTIRSLELRYLYCVRDPRRVFRSLLSMPWGAGTSPDGFLDRVEQSFLHLSKIDEPERRLRVVNVNHFSRDVQSRVAKIPSLLNDLGLTVGDAALRFISEWPHVNRTHETSRAQEASEEELRAFDWAYDGRPRLRKTIEEMLESGTLPGIQTTARDVKFRAPVVVRGHSPGAPVTRAEFAELLLRATYGFDYRAPPLAAGEETSFADVPADHWAAGWVRQLALEGITTGTADGRFDPDSVVTRDQAAVFLLRAKYRASTATANGSNAGRGCDPYLPPDAGEDTGFTDVPPDHWAAAWIKQMAADGVTRGCGSGRYCPDHVLTREHLATFLARLGGIL